MKANCIIGVLFIVFLLTLSFKARGLEVDYQEAWCPNKPGTTLRDPLSGKVVGYVDCLTKTHAYEFDFAKSMKQYEAIGQALKYAMFTGRRPGIVFIAAEGRKNKYVMEAQAIINHYNLPIDIEVMPK
tara:strand:+ start:56932 stop:57315 length:384 start_codon:yes stop_codon:yes gene_type:complete